MTPELYSQIVPETALFLREDYTWSRTELEPAYITLGICGEVGEFIDAVSMHRKDTHGQRENIIKEGGDVLWYIAAQARAFDIEIYDIWPEAMPVVYEAQLDSALVNLTRTAFRIAESVKKFYRDGKDITMSLQQDLMIVLETVQTCTVGLLDAELGEIAEVNYLKLMERKAKNTIQGDGDNR